MCGIAGFYNKTGNSRNNLSLVKVMVERMKHRGPDSEGFFSDSRVQFGMCRLSVIDLETGNQPIYSSNDRVIVIMNGEIYNFKEIRQEYLTRGYRFKTKCDTEVILPLYLNDSLNFVNKINGMFAFALYDKLDNTLLLARDRLGIKPLFYYNDSDNFIFSSELYPLAAILKNKLTIDHNALDLYFTLGYIPYPFTLYKQIRRFPPATIGRINDKQLSFVPFWKVSFAEKRITETECVDRLNDLISASVKRQMISDVPVGLYMGGGLDSAALAVAASKANNKLSIFNLALEDAHFDESREARQIANKCNFDIHVLKFNPDELVKILHKRVSNFAEPFSSWANCGIQFISSFAKEKIKVALIGSGGDELFAGYPTITAHKIAQKLQFLDKNVINILKKISMPANLRGRYDAKLISKMFFDAIFYHPEVRYILFKQILSADKKQIIYQRDFLDSITKDNLDNYIFMLLEEIPSPTALINKLLFLDIRMFLGSCVLHSFDYAMMFHSIEGRVPLLDNDLVDFTLTIPHKLKHRGLVTKYILRKTFNNKLPFNILNMRKRGFSLPLNDWMRQGSLKKFIEEVLYDKKSKNDDYLKHDKVYDIYKKHLVGVSDYSRLLSMLVSYFLWKEWWNKQDDCPKYKS